MERIIRNFKSRWPAIVFVLGIGFLFGPYLDGWSEVFCPRISHYLWMLVIVWRWVALGAFVSHCVYFAITLRRKWSLKYRVLVTIPLVILPLTWRVMYPPGITTTDRRISSFAIGGWMRVMWAGGPSKVRNDALNLVDATSYSVPPKSEWPASIRALGATYVEVHKGSRTANVYIPRQNVFFADQFGFLIRDAGAPAPDVNHYADAINGYRLWKLADGVYLYEIW